MKGIIIMELFDEAYYSGDVSNLEAKFPTMMMDWYWLTFDKISFDKISVDKISVDKISFDKSGFR